MWLIVRILTAINVPKTTINFSVEKSDDDQGMYVHALAVLCIL